MFKKNAWTIIYSIISSFRVTFPASIFAVFSLSGCKSGSSDTTTLTDEIDTTSNNSTGSTQDIITEKYLTIEAGTQNFGTKGIRDIVTAEGVNLTKNTSLKDESPYDNDMLTVNFNTDLLDAPIIDGIEEIIFTTSETSLEVDNEFDIDLINISNYSVLKIENTNDNSVIKSINVDNLGSSLFIGKHFSNIKLNSLKDADIFLTASSNLTLSASGEFNDLNILAGGKSITLISSTSEGDVILDNANVVDLNASSALGNIDITANGAVTIQDISSLKGNITVTSVGSIDIRDASAAEGTLNLSNERALATDNITITNASAVGRVIIKSAGAVVTKASNGLNSASQINITANKDSTIYADGVDDQEITLNTSNPTGDSTTFTLHSSKLEKLTLGGTSPIVVNIDGADISTETVTSSNRDATILLGSSNADLSNIDSSIKILVNNLDGNTLTVGSNQTVQLDAEIDQTSSSSKPIFDHSRDATSSTSYNFTLKSFDSNSNNTDTTVDLAGLVVTDIQTLNIDLSTGVGLNSSSDITGIDLTSVILSGSGKFDLNSNTITGSDTTRVVLDASSLTESVTICLDSTTNSVAKITTGSAADTIKIDGVTSDSSGFEVSTKESDDYIQITSSGDGSTAKITIDGGRGSDTIALDTNVDLSLSNLSISSVENITLARGGSSQKIAASDISGESFKLFSTGSGTAKLSVVVDQATINLSKLTFDSSFKNGYESIEVDASSSSASVNITGSSADEALTGSNANDTLLGSDGADIISAGTGNDTLEGGLGADTMTGGAGDDEFDFSSNASTENLMDKITDYQAAAEASSNDTIDNITGSVGANTSSTDVKSAISGGNGSETVTAAVTNGIVTLSGSNASSINTLSEWIDAVSVDGVIAAAADDADAVGTVAFAFNGNTYLVESNDTFNNNTANVSIVNVIELTGLTGVSAVASDAAAANTILIA